ncbi:MAG: AIR carboxylase family protein, partial [Eubacterium sp.]|nr:AIR carboxylase family protein [Eubacterium sp.]
AAAGMAAHLGGVLAASTTLPVIGIPPSAEVLDGMDSMLATIMMPPGIPVASVGVNAAKNAALLAAEILAVGDDALMQKLKDMRKEMAAAVIEKDKALQEKIKEI